MNTSTSPGAKSPSLFLSWPKNFQLSLRNATYIKKKNPKRILLPETDWFQHISSFNSFIRVYFMYMTSLNVYITSLNICIWRHWIYVYDVIEYDMWAVRGGWAEQWKVTCFGIWLPEFKSYLSYLLHVGVGQATQPYCVYSLIVKQEWWHYLFHGVLCQVRKNLKNA